MNELPLLLGFSGALIHVFTGPDHLAAVTPAAMNPFQKGWVTGLAWAVGHLVGITIIGGLFLVFKSLIPVEAISSNSEIFIAITLIFMGIISFTSIRRRPNDHKHSNSPRVKKYGLTLGIGLLHGFAGVSHIIFLLPAFGFTSNAGTIQYLIGFGIGTFAAMIGFSMLLAFMRNKAQLGENRAVLYRLRIGAGLFTMIVGVIWLALSLN